MSFLPSNDVRIYPCAYRDGSIDKKSRLNLEENIVALGANGLGKDKSGSYIITADLTTDQDNKWRIKAVIGGYYVEINTAANNINAGDYLIIKTDLVGNVRVLAPLDGITTVGNCLDVGGNFVGLLVANELPTAGTNEIIYNVKITDNEDGDDFSDRLPDIKAGIGKHAIALGEGTIAAGENQFVFGKYNTSDSSTYAEIVGAGTSTSAVNIRTLDWEGNEILASSLSVPTLYASDITSNGQLNISATTISLSGNTSMHGDIIPTSTNTYDLGLASLAWKSIYGSNIYTTNIYPQNSSAQLLKLNNNTITTYGRIIPNNDNNLSIGTSSLRFNEANIENIYGSNFMSLTGALSLFASTNIDIAAFNILSFNVISLNSGVNVLGNVALTSDALSITASSIFINFPSGRPGYAPIQVLPQGNGPVDLGASSSKFNSIFTNSLNATNLSGFSVYGSIVPYATNSYNLGASDKQFKNLWVSAISANKSLDIIAQDSATTNSLHLGLISGWGSGASEIASIYFNHGTGSQAGKGTINLSAAYINIGSSFAGGGIIDLNVNTSNIKFGVGGKGTASKPIYINSSGIVQECSEIKSGGGELPDTIEIGGCSPDVSSTKTWYLPSYWKSTGFADHINYGWIRIGNVIKFSIEFTTVGNGTISQDNWMVFKLAQLIKAAGSSATTGKVIVSGTPKRTSLTNYGLNIATWADSTYVYFGLDDVNGNCRGFNIEVTIYLG